MTRVIELYSEITGGIKRCNVDLLINGKVSDRNTSDGYTHTGVDEYAMRYALDMAQAYNIPQGDITDRGLVEYREFVALAAR